MISAKDATKLRLEALRSIKRIVRTSVKTVVETPDNPTSAQLKLTKIRTLPGPLCHRRLECAEACTM